MSGEKADFFDIAVNNALHHFKPRPSRRPVGYSHWSYFDDPWTALCGERIAPEQFSRTPTCQVCLQALQRMQDEDIR